jgi:hypothetical protein
MYVKRWMNTCMDRWIDGYSDGWFRWKGRFFTKIFTLVAIPPLQVIASAISPGWS